MYDNYYYTTKIPQLTTILANAYKTKVIVNTLFLQCLALCMCVYNNIIIIIMLIEWFEWFTIVRMCSNCRVKKIPN